MKELMIDLETLGTNPDCPVIALGAAWFDLEKRKIGDTFYAVLDVADQIDSRIRFADASTIKWWMSQSGAAKQVFKDNPLATKAVLETFRLWIMEHAGSKAKSTKKCFPYGNGAGFDITIMESLFKSYDVDCPWLFYNIRDFRTFKEYVAGNAKVAKLEGTEHNALDDAVNQINYMFEHYHKDKK